MGLITSKLHVRNLKKSENFLIHITDNTPVRFAYVKRNHHKNTGYIVLIGEKRFVDYTVKCLRQRGILTGDTSHCLPKYYA